MKHITIFNAHTNYNTYSQSNYFIIPNVSYCISEDEIHYTPELSHTMISFVVRAVHGSENVTYQAEEGMTWGEWVNTPYNTDGWEVYTYTNPSSGTTTSYIVIPNSISIYAGSGQNIYTVIPEDTIMDNYSYGTAIAPGVIVDE